MDSYWNELRVYFPVVPNMVDSSIWLYLAYWIPYSLVIDIPFPDIRTWLIHHLGVCLIAITNQIVVHKNKFIPIHLFYVDELHK